MRNLRNIRLQEARLSGDLPLTATAWDAATDAVICAFGPTKCHAVIEVKRNALHLHSVTHLDLEPCQLIASWDAPCPLPDLECDRILSLQYFADTLTTCLVLEGGDIIIVREDAQPGEDKVEIVGSVDVGITAAAWAPDEELLAITTRSNTLLYMTRNFENVTDITFTSEDLRVSRHVSVGWGKKETQFRGKRAKALRDPTIPEKVDEGKLSNHDNGCTSLSWRGDGAFVAVNSVESESRRVIRVYSREGGLDSVSEPVDGLEGALSWRPAGNLIAGIRRLEDHMDIVFFERNGLRHGQFALRLNKEERETWGSNINLAWNIDSTVLAVQFKDRVQLWTMGNYHYYLKQEIRTGVGLENDNALISFRWHPEKAIRFVAGSPCSVLDGEWTFEVIRGSTSAPEDFGAVAVIDGKTLKLTPLRRSAVPPPMALCEVQLDSNAIDIAFSKSGAQIAALTTLGVSLYRWDLKATPVREPKLQSFYPFPHLSTRPKQISFLNETEVYILKQCPFLPDEIERTCLDTRETMTAFCSKDSGSVSCLFPDLVQNVLWFSQLGLYGKPNSYSTISYDEPCNKMSVTVWNESPAQDTYWAQGTQLGDGERMLFSLSKSGALYANKRLLAKNCTSFLLTITHLIFTTAQHLLKFVHISKVDELDIPDDVPEASELCRAIERGGRLVTVMPSIFAVVLQMPRGNTETVYPRALVLAGIRKYIDNKDYRAAFLACRNQMVDMNILHDYSPVQFMSSIQLFIEQVNKIEFIDEFLSRLREEDVSETLYKDTLKMANTAETASGLFKAKNDMANEISAKLSKTGKVNRICDAMLTALSNKTDTNLRNLVTAHVCKAPPDLDAGLKLVVRLREQSQEQAEEAIEHMCFLTDAYRLYDHALGLYDLELTLMVAQQSQKDPREYLPFLQGLQEMPELRRQYEIDNYLGRFPKALKALHSLRVHDELKLYAIKHTLYSEALELYKYQPELLRDMSQLYADYLYDQSDYKEAAIAYESLSLYESAYQSYKLAHMWRESLYCASLVPLSEAQLANLALSLAVTLSDETKDYVSAAHIHAQHLHDIPAAARLLCRGLQFADACRLLALHSQQELIPDIVDSALGDSMSSIIDLLADCKGQLQAQVPRIGELRIRRAADPLGFFGGDPTADPDGPDIPDNLSLAPTDASTMASRSLFTRYTSNTSSSRKTSRTRRREERRRARGKKGTVYEEEYLVNSVRRLVERVNNAVDEVETLVQAMLRRGMRERAILVAKNLDEVLGMCRDCLEDVFEVAAPGVLATALPGEMKGYAGDGARPSGADGLVLDTMEEPYAQTNGEWKAPPPVVKEFKKLALLRGYG